MKIDAARALPMVETALLEARDELAGAGLLGPPASSSRMFIFQLLARETVRTLIDTGRAESRTTYEELQTAWLAKKQGGKDSLQPAVTFSRWVEQLHRPDPTVPGAPKCYATATADGAFDVKLRILRPRDDGSVGTAGFVVSIERDGREVEVTPNPRLVPGNDFFADAGVKDEERERAIEQILSTLDKTLRVQPREVLQRILDDPSELTIRQSTTFWTSFKKIAARASQAAGVVLALLLLVYAAAPAEARAAAREAVYGLVVKWCPFCDQPGRTWSWTFERPDLYYSPASVRLPLKRADFGVLRPGTARTDAESEMAIEVQSLSEDGLLVRIRVVPPPELRTNATKYYINYADQPERKGDANHLVTLGPAAVFEHRYTTHDRYPLRVGVTTRSSAPDPAKRSDMPPTEADGWTIVASATATIDVGTSPD